MNLSRKLLVTGNINPIDTIKKTSSIVSKINNEDKDLFSVWQNHYQQSIQNLVMIFLMSYPYYWKKSIFNKLVHGIPRYKNSENHNIEFINDFFTLKSKESREIIDSLSSSIELSKVKDIIRNYSLALTGRQIEVKESSQLAEKI